MMSSDSAQDVSRETMDRLIAFRDLVLKWNKRINLVSPSTEQVLWDRHIVDSLQFWPENNGNIQKWIDLGSGGGFPGIVVACMAQQSEETPQVILVESDKRKGVFLKEVIRSLSLSQTIVLTNRIEGVDPLMSDVISARALAPLTTLLNHAKTHLTKGGTAIFAKGATAEKEVEEAKRNWRFDLSYQKSKTDPSARILHITNIEQV